MLATSQAKPSQALTLKFIQNYVYLITNYIYVFSFNTFKIEITNCINRSFLFNILLKFKDIKNE